MSTLEWRREQPRVSPPQSDGNKVVMALLLFDSFVWAASFVVHGNCQGLGWALVFGFIATKVP